MTDENATVLRTYIIDLAKAYEDQTLTKRAKVAWDILDRMDEILDSEPVEQPAPVLEDHHRAQIASLSDEPWMVVAANMEPLVVEPPTVKPPGHTCPAIDKVIEATRKIKWRIDKPERHHEMADLCLAIFVLMEQVRDENRQMRAAHADMQRRILDV
jgi:hypothetical protein